MELDFGQILGDASRLFRQANGFARFTLMVHGEGEVRGRKGPAPRVAVRLPPIDDLSENAAGFVILALDQSGEAQAVQPRRDSQFIPVVPMDLKSLFSELDSAAELAVAPVRPS